jgi:hypothetical protein
MKKKKKKKSSLSEQFQNEAKSIPSTTKTPHIFLDWHSTSLQRLRLVVWANKMAKLKRIYYDLQNIHIKLKID